jgi:hypothetical protein
MKVESDLILLTEMEHLLSGIVKPAKKRVGVIILYVTEDKQTLTVDTNQTRGDSRMRNSVLDAASLSATITLMTGKPVTTRSALAAKRNFATDLAKRFGKSNTELWNDVKISSCEEPVLDSIIEGHAIRGYLIPPDISALYIGNAAFASEPRGKRVWPDDPKLVPPILKWVCLGIQDGRGSTAAKDRLKNQFTRSKEH